MQIQLVQIGPEGLEVDEPVALDWLAGVFGADPLSMVEPVAATRASGRLRRAGRDVLVELSCPLRLRTECAKCLKVIELDVPVSFRLNLKPATAAARQLPGEQELTAADLDQVSYQGDTLDLSELLREQIILALPMHPRCAPDCRGLCQSCGMDLNEADCSCQGAVVDPRLAVLDSFKAR